MEIIEIPGYSGYYADKDGNIYSCVVSAKPRKMSLCLQKARGKKTYLRLKIARVTRLAHRVIAGIKLARPLNEDELVNHLDGDTMNNCLDNLEVTSHKGNVQHAVENKLYCSGPAWYEARGLEMLGTARTFND